MHLRRDQLTILFNRLYDAGHERLEVAHPADEIGTLLTVELGSHDDCTVRFDTDRDDYIDATEDIRTSYAEAVYDDLPSPAQYVKAVLASGIIPVANRDEVEAFLERYGDPDLMAGHPPVVAGVDTNLLPWRIDEILGLRDPDAGIGYVNGFVLAGGVRDELDWDYKCGDTDPFEEAYDDRFAEYWNQPVGDARIGRLGLNAYRKIRDIEEADEIDSGTGDEAIVAAYDEYDDEHRNDVILFSNDRNFVERARSHTLLGQHVELPKELPREATASWRQVEQLVYTLAIVFGVIEVPKTTVFGVWRGKDGMDWREERVEVDCRSTTIEPNLYSDLTIVDTYRSLEEE